MPARYLCFMCWTNPWCSSWAPWHLQSFHNASPRWNILLSLKERPKEERLRSHLLPATQFSSCFLSDIVNPHRWVMVAPNFDLWAGWLKITSEFYMISVLCFSCPAWLPESLWPVGWPVFGIKGKEGVQNKSDCYLFYLMRNLSNLISSPKTRLRAVIREILKLIGLNKRWDSTV